MPPDLLRTNATLVTQKVNLAGLVADILEMQPDTTNIAVIFGASRLEKFWVAGCRRQFQPFTDRVGFTRLNELSLAEVVQRSAAQPPHSFILFGMFVIDATGVPFWHVASPRDCCAPTRKSGRAWRVSCTTT